MSREIKLDEPPIYVGGEVVFGTHPGTLSREPTYWPAEAHLATQRELDVAVAAFLPLPPTIPAPPRPFISKFSTRKRRQ